MKQLLFFALILVCPLAMMFMMRGHGHGMSDPPQDAADPATTDARIAELEQEVARLRAHEDAMQPRPDQAAPR